jgi:L-alanine-DL-glutamate epimerase-like enolase superfamily enzyme
MSVAASRSCGASLEEVSARCYTIPTDAPESDGTIEWDRTTLVLARVCAGGQTGIGYSYASRAAARVISDVLKPAIVGSDAMAIPAMWWAMWRAVRNVGAAGIAFNAISAVDVALWDLKAKLLGISVVTLLGPARSEVVAYGSGGFTSYDDTRLCEQLGRWAEQGFRFVKMKVGRDPVRDRARVRVARGAIGPKVGLFVDANGAHDRKVALEQAQYFAEQSVTWFEEPVSSDDLAGLRALRDRLPPGMEVAAGEYGYTPVYFARMLSADAVDVLQADATRCGGFTGMLAVAALTQARSLDLSAHCAPALHAHVGCAIGRLRHLEYFHDHARIERLLFEGAPEPRAGALRPDLERAGLGMELKLADAERFAAD